jgi:pimeloyl-ACP methyl ester carboxylesterase
MTIESIARDGNRVTELVQDRLGQQRVILLGWSWGSAVGLHMIKARPDLYAAFVGTGQVVDMDEGEALAYEQVLAKARQRGDREAIADLEAIGPPPYDSLAELSTQRRWAATYEGYGSTSALLAGELLAPRSSLQDVWHLIAGVQRSTMHFFGPTLKGPFAGTDLRTLGLRYDVPVYIVQGTADDYTPAEPSRRFVEEISAPDKAFVPVADAGHFAVVTHAAEFLTMLTDLVARLDGVSR